MKAFACSHAATEKYTCLCVLESVCGIKLHIKLNDSLFFDKKLFGHQIREITCSWDPNYTSCVWAWGFFNSKILLILALGLTFVHFEIIYLMTKVEMSLSRVFTFLWLFLKLYLFIEWARTEFLFCIFPKNSNTSNLFWFKLLLWMDCLVYVHLNLKKG